MQAGVRAWCDATQLALTARGGGRCTPHDHQAGFLRHRAIRVKELLPKQQHTTTHLLPAPKTVQRRCGLSQYSREPGDRNTRPALRAPRVTGTVPRN